MTRHEHAERLESAPLSLYQLARVTDAAWPPPPQYGPPLPQYGPPPPQADPLPRQHPPMHRAGRARIRAQLLKDERFRAVCESVAPQRSSDKYDLAVARASEMSKTGVKLARRRLGIVAKVNPA